MNLCTSSSQSRRRGREFPVREGAGAGRHARRWASGGRHHAKCPHHPRHSAETHAGEKIAVSRRVGSARRSVHAGRRVRTDQRQTPAEEEEPSPIRPMPPPARSSNSTREKLPNGDWNSSPTAAARSATSRFIVTASCRRVQSVGHSHQSAHADMPTIEEVWTFIDRSKQSAPSWPTASTAWS